MSNKQDGEFSAFVPLHKTCSTYRLAASTSSARIAIAPGNYKVFLKGADPSAVVFCALGTSGVTASEVTAGSSATSTLAFRGDEIERIVVNPADTHIAAILSTSATSADLVLVLLAP